jgi:hypothetical protein
MRHLRQHHRLLVRTLKPGMGGTSKKSCHTGLDDRRRDHDGEIRHKNSNTRVDTLRETYGDGFAKGSRGDMHLRTLLERSGVNSLSEYLKKK